MLGEDTWALKKAQKNKFEVAEMRMLRRVYGVNYSLDNIINERIRDNESGANRKENPGKVVEVVWACDEKRGALRRKVGDGREKEETGRGFVWTK